MKSRKKHFTLMEVMIAATILALAAVATMGVVGSARATLLRAQKRWARQHLLASVAELYLLAGHKAQLPEDLLPQGFSSSCELREVDDIHSEAQEPINGWQLGEYHIRVYDVNGVAMAETKVRKVLKEEDFD
jgi:type II secretory pathway pseudopilin PulG